MAFFRGSTAFDINTLNLSRLIAQQTGFVFLDNINELTGNSTEQDLIGIQYTDGGSRSVYLGGSGFKVNADGNVTAGTVRALSLFSGDLNDLSAPTFILNRLTVSAKDIFSAAKTSSTVDDLLLLSSALGGDDTFRLSEGNDTINAFGGNDKLYGNGGSDNLNGGAGNDILAGGNGDDILTGGAGNDGMGGGAGNDMALYSAATSAVTVDLRISTAQNTGGAGSDTLSGIESVTGSTFNDTLSGSKLANTLVGGLGQDTLSGNEGIDLLIGGAGQDTLTGGTGADKFVFDATVSAAGSVFDTITDFSSAQGDRIVLSKAVFAGLTGAAGTALAESAFFASTTATGANDASDRVIYNTTTGALFYDADGTGKAAAVQIALIGTTTHPALVFGDFLISA